jgi:hypothetical protein
MIKTSFGELWHEVYGQDRKSTPLLVVMGPGF